MKSPKIPKDLVFKQMPLEIGFSNSLLQDLRFFCFKSNEAYGIEVCEMMREMGYMNVELKHDMYGKPRMVFGTIMRQS